MKTGMFGCRSAARFSGKAGLVALLAAASLTVASPASAAIVCFSPAASIPPTFDGLYINLFTGVVGADAASAPNWDFNPWGTGTPPALNFNTAGTAAQGGYVSSGGVVSALASGATVGPAATYIQDQTTATGMGLYRAGVTASTYLGFRFTEGTSLYYGWMSLTTTATTGFPATVNNWCFENVPNTSINAGTTPVTLQEYSVD